MYNETSSTNKLLKDPGVFERATSSGSKPDVRYRVKKTPQESHFIYSIAGTFPDKTDPEVTYEIDSTTIAAWKAVMSRQDLHVEAVNDKSCQKLWGKIWSSLSQVPAYLDENPSVQPREDRSISLDVDWSPRLFHWTCTCSEPQETVGVEMQIDFVDHVSTTDSDSIGFAPLGNRDSMATSQFGTSSGVPTRDSVD